MTIALTSGMRDELERIGGSESHIKRARKVIATEGNKGGKMTPGRATKLRNAHMVVDVWENGPGAGLSLMALAPPMTFAEHDRRMLACEEHNTRNDGINPLIDREVA